MMDGNEAYKSVGILDSGVGGLTVVEEFYRQLPHENIVYFGDTERMPYGPRPQSEVRRFAMEIIDFLQTQDIKKIVVACNSATAAGITYYREKLDIPVTGVIEPGVRAALKATKNGCIGVIGTRGTIESGAYENDLHRLNPEIKVISKPCPLLVLIVENNLINEPESRRVTEEYLTPLIEGGIDTLILGCTHYPLMAELIRDVAGEEITLISSAKEIAREAKEFFKKEKIMNPLQDYRGRHRFFVSGKPNTFEKIGKNLLGEEIKAYQVVF